MKFTNKIYFYLCFVVLLFIVFRLSTVFTAVNVVKNDLINMLWRERDFSYQSKIEKTWRNDYRFAKLVSQILVKGEKIFLPEVENNIVHPNIIKYFVYPIETTSMIEEDKFSFYGFYPGNNTILDKKCKNVYIFNLDFEQILEIDCRLYLGNKDLYVNSFGVVRLQ